MAASRNFVSPLSHYDSTDLLDALTTGMVVLDAQLCVIYANVAAQEALGISFNSVRGRPFTGVVLEADHLLTTLRRATAEGAVLTEREIGIKIALLGNQAATAGKQRGADFKARTEMVYQQDRQRAVFEQEACAPAIDQLVRTLELPLQPRVVTAAVNRYP